MSDFALSFLSGSQQTAHTSLYSGLAISAAAKVTSTSASADDYIKIQQLEQRVMFLEKDKAELLEREDALQKLNEQIMSAFDTCNSKPSVARVTSEELLILEDKHAKEIKLLKQEKNDIHNHLAQENAKMLSRLQDKESEIFRLRGDVTELAAQVMAKEYAMIEVQKASDSISAEKKCMLKEVEREKEHLQSQIGILQKKLDKATAVHSQDRQRQFSEVEQNVQNIRLLHEHEKHLLWTQLRGVQAEKQVVQSACDAAQAFLEEVQRKHQLEREDHSRIVKQLEYRIEVLEKENLKIGMYEQLQATHEGQLRQKESILADTKRRCVEQIKEVNLEVKKLEQAEKNLLQLLKDKDTIIEDNRKEFQKRLALEKLKADNLLEAGNKIKEEYTKRNAFVIQGIIAKEEQVKSISKQLLNYGVSVNKTPATAISSKSQMTFWTESLKRTTNNTMDQDTIDYINVPAVLNNNTNTNNTVSCNTNGNCNSQQLFSELAQRLSSPGHIRNHSPKSIDESFFKGVAVQQPMGSSHSPLDLNVTGKLSPKFSIQPMVINASGTTAPMVRKGSVDNNNNTVKMSARSTASNLRGSTPSLRISMFPKESLRESQDLQTTIGISSDYLIPFKSVAPKEGTKCSASDKDRKSKANPLKERVSSTFTSKSQMSLNTSRPASILTGNNQYKETKALLEQKYEVDSDENDDDGCTADEGITAHLVHDTANINKRLRFSEISQQQMAIENTNNANYEIVQQQIESSVEQQQQYQPNGNGVLEINLANKPLNQNAKLIMKTSSSSSAKENEFSSQSTKRVVSPSRKTTAIGVSDIRSPRIAGEATKGTMKFNLLNAQSTRNSNHGVSRQPLRSSTTMNANSCSITNSSQISLNNKTNGSTVISFM